MEQYQGEWEEISQTIDEHIHLMMERYLETGNVFRCISSKIGFFPYSQCLRKVLADKDWDRLNNFIYQENCFRSLCSLMCGDTHLDLCQYFGQKKSKDYAAFLSSSSSFC